jgi:hypothetical protein
MKPGENRVLLVLSLLVLLSLFVVGLVFLEVSYVGRVVEEGISSSVTVVGDDDPIEPVEPPVSSGGGGGVSLSPKEKFIIDKDLIKVLVKQGESERTTLEIMNFGEAGLNIELDEDPILSRLMIMSEREFFLGPGQVKIINIDIFARENEIADAYTGRIIIRSGKLEGIVNVIIEVEEKNPLFDIKVKVDRKQLNRGEIIGGNISVINMGDLRGFDVMLYYSIKNFRDEVFFFREESIAIDERFNVVRNFEIPMDAPFDDYVFYSRVNFENISAASVDSFEVKEPMLERPMFETWMESKYFMWIVILLLILILLAIAVVGYVLYRRLSFWGFVRRKNEERDLRAGIDG